MDCTQARSLIDQRLQAAKTAEADLSTDSPADWSELEAHLAQCRACAADDAELRLTQTRLGYLSSDAPSTQEIETMWSVIQAESTPKLSLPRIPSKIRRSWPFLLAGSGIAAVLLIALQVGQARYGSEWAMGTAGEIAKWPASGETMLRRGFAAAGNGAAGAAPEIAAGRPIERLQSLGYASSDEGKAGDAGRYRFRGKDATADRRDSLGKEVFKSTVVGVPFIPTTPPPPPASPPPPAPVLGQADNKAPVYMYEPRYVSAANIPDSYAGPDVDAHLGFPAEGKTAGEVYLGEKLAESAGYSVGTAIRGAETALHDRFSAGREGLQTGGPAAETAAREPADQEPAAPETAPPAPPVQPKIIKTGELTVEVDRYRDAVQRVEELVARFGGFVADGSTQEQTGGALLGRLAIRVPPEQFEGLFGTLKGIGRLIAENVKAADVTAAYVDMEARIQNLQITEQRLQELVKSKSIIDKISSLLEVEKELTRVRTENEQLQGQLRVMANRISLSTITMILREPARTVPSASLSVEVIELGEAAKSLGEAVERLGGRLESGKTSKREDGTLMGEYKLQVSLARFGELLAAVETLGRVEQRQVADRQFGDAAAPWAERVQCAVALVLYERSRQLPAGSMRLEIEDLGAAMPKLDGVAASSGASIVSNRTVEQSDGTDVAELRLRVPAGQFAALAAALEPLGRTVSKELSGESGKIVGGAAGVPTELNLTLAEQPREVPGGSMVVEAKNFSNARQQLSNIIAARSVQVQASASNQRTDGTWQGQFRLAAKAGEIEALVSQLEALGRVVSRQTSGLGLGDLARTDPNALGTIDLTLTEKATITPEPDRASGSIRQSIRDGLAGLYASLGLIAYGLVAIAPWLVIVLLGAWIIVRLVRRRSANAAKAK